MTKLHELLVVEKIVVGAWNTILPETQKKFGNEHFFSGHTKTLSMIEDTPGNNTIKATDRDHKTLPTNVHDTLEYALRVYANAENLQADKNITNASARADVEFRGEVLFENLPVDQLLGLEARINKIRKMYLAIPTLDAGKAWTYDAALGCWTAEPEHAIKTEKIMFPVVMAPATDRHPAQIKESTKDNTVGKFTLVRRSGAATAKQKAEAILLVEVKKARMRANEAQVASGNKIGTKLAELLLSPFKN